MTLASVMIDEVIEIESLDTPSTSCPLSPNAADVLSSCGGRKMYVTGNDNKMLMSFIENVCLGKFEKNYY